MLSSSVSYTLYTVIFSFHHQINRIANGRKIKRSGANFLQSMSAIETGYENESSILWAWMHLNGTKAYFFVFYILNRFWLTRIISILNNMTSNFWSAVIQSDTGNWSTLTGHNGLTFSKSEEVTPPYHQKNKSVIFICHFLVSSDFFPKFWILSQ